MNINISVWLALGVVVALIVVAIAIATWLDKRPQTAWDRWYKRIDEFPSTKALILFAIGLFFTTGLVVAGNAAYFSWTDKQPSPLLISALDTWLDKVLILSGIGTVHFIGKRATTKVELEKPNAEAGE